MSLRIEAACGCNIGRRRSNNEDNFYFNNRILPKDNEGLKYSLTMEQPLDKEIYFGVFDGMGGESFGEEASYVAAEVAKNSKRQLIDYIYPVRKYLKNMILKMNQKVCEKSEQLDSGRMGSTAVILHLNGDYAYVCNVGDSRAFRLRQGEFQQISEDHTDAKFLASQGITNRKPSLTQHLGIWPEEMVLEPYVAKGALSDGDQYLLCSDGLTDMVSNTDICAIMKSSNNSCECVDALIETALKNGGKDNVTIIVIRVREV